MLLDLEIRLIYGGNHFMVMMFMALLTMLLL